MSWVFFVQSYWSSLALILLQHEIISWLTQFEFENFLQGLVRQNNQYLQKHTISSKINLDIMSNSIQESILT
jgi:hypothetical protein